MGLPYAVFVLNGRRSPFLLVCVNGLRNICCKSLQGGLLGPRKKKSKQFRDTLQVIDNHGIFCSLAQLLKGARALNPDAELPQISSQTFRAGPP
jgi:hypothetical protein